MVRSACGGGGVTTMAILMCPPDHFGVEYEINPWMHVQVAVDRAAALEQWDALHRTYDEMGVDIELATPHRGLPDMVFTANAAVLAKDRAVLSRFHHAERAGEEQHWRVELQRLGYTVHELPEDVSFEGAGDALFFGDTLVCGHGFRTDESSHQMVADLLDVEVVSVQLVDPRFYHLDTCFCPIDERTALIAPEAFSAASLERLRALVPNPVEVPSDVAAGFACNAMPVGDRVVSSSSISAVAAPLRRAGYEAVALPVTEFMKSGGGVRCLSLPLMPSGG